MCLFGTYIFSLHCINLHLFACCFVSILKAFPSPPLTCVLFCVPSQNTSFLKAETMSLVSFVFPIAPFTVLSREWAYCICCGMTSWVIPPWLGLRLNFLKWNSPNQPRTGILHLACWLLLSTCYLKWLPSALFVHRVGPGMADDLLAVCIPGESADTRTDLGASEVPSWPCNMAWWKEDSIAGRGKTWGW